MIKKMKGSILVFTLIIMSLILVTALTLSTTMIIERKASTITRSSAAAIQGADSGLEYILTKFRTDYDSSQTYDAFVSELITDLPASATAMYCEDGSAGLANTGDLVIELDDPIQKIRIIAIAKDASGVDMPPVRCDDSTSATSPPTSGIVLQDIVAFKAIGEDRIAKRALRIDMGKSIDRGLVLFWDFEDYENAYHTINGQEDHILTVVDKSKKGNVAHLCPDSERTSSSVCSGSGDDMNPGPHHYRNKYNDGISWYGDRNFHKTQTPGEPKGIADHDLDTNTHWAMAFNLNEAEAPSPTPPNEYLIVEDPTAFGFLNRENFTISMWVRPKDLSGDQDVLRKGADTNNKKYVIKVKDDDTIQFTVQNNATRRIQFSSSSLLIADEWHHVTMTVRRYGAGNKSAEVTGYINGSSVGNGAYTNMWGVNDNGKHIIMGSNDVRDDHFFKGWIDDVRIYDRVLSQEEITQLCAQGTTSDFTETKCTP